MPKRVSTDELPDVDDIESSGLYYRRLIDLVAAGKLSHATVALEFFASLVGASKRSEVDVEKLVEALPVEALRNNTVPVPLGFLEVLALAWLDYREGDDVCSFSQKLGIDGKGQGKSGSLKRLKMEKRKLMLHRLVQVELMLDPSISVESAWYLVAEKNGCSPQTVQKAYAQHRDGFRELIDALKE